MCLSCIDKERKATKENIAALKNAAIANGILFLVTSIIFITSGGFEDGFKLLLAQAIHAIVDVVFLICSMKAMEALLRKTVTNPSGNSGWSIIVSILTQVVFIGSVSFIAWNVITNLHVIESYTPGSLMLNGLIEVVINHYASSILKQKRGKQNLIVKTTRLHFLLDKWEGVGEFVLGASALLLHLPNPMLHIIDVFWTLGLCVAFGYYGIVGFIDIQKQLSGTLSEGFLEELKASVLNADWARKTVHQLTFRTFGSVTGGYYAQIVIGVSSTIPKYPVNNVTGQNIETLKGRVKELLHEHGVILVEIESQVWDGKYWNLLEQASNEEVQEQKQESAINVALKQLLQAGKETVSLSIQLLLLNLGSSLAQFNTTIQQRIVAQTSIAVEAEHEQVKAELQEPLAVSLTSTNNTGAIVAFVPIEKVSVHHNENHVHSSDCDCITT